MRFPAPTPKGHSLDKFRHPKLDRRFPVHVCRAGCIAFIGNYSNCQECPCGLPRYRRCTRRACRSGNRAEICNNPLHHRIPFKELYYYSLTLRIVTDIHLGKLPSMLCNAFVNNPFSGQYDDPLHIYDVVASPVALSAMADMEYDAG